MLGGVSRPPGSGKAGHFDVADVVDGITAKIIHAIPTYPAIFPRRTRLLMVSQLGGDQAGRRAVSAHRSSIGIPALILP